MLSHAKAPLVPRCTVYHNTCTQFLPLENYEASVGEGELYGSGGAYRVAREPAKAPSHHATLT